MDYTPRLALPYIAPQQAQKQVTYNEAMRVLDLLVQPAVKSRSLGTPPGSPAEGDAYIVPAGATGAWSGQAQKLAVWRDGAWSLQGAAEGWLAFVVDDAEIAVFTSGAWGALVANGYAEGTWTPGVSFGGASVGVSYAAATQGRYTRIGRVVHVTGLLELTSKGSSTGGALLTGLPFAAANISGYPQAGAIGRVDNMSGLSGGLGIVVLPNSTSMELSSFGSGAASVLDDANFSDSSAIRFAASYEIAS